MRLAFAFTTVLLLVSSNIGVAADNPKQATKENPYVNSLGMKFVPVPGTKVLFCTTETTVDQYKMAGLGYRAPGFAQNGNHPAVDVSWNDAMAFCVWLSKRDHKKYRLPTDREWSFAVGIGDMENAGGSPGSKDRKLPDVFPWGKQGKGSPPPAEAGNYAGQELRNLKQDAIKQSDTFFEGFPVISGYNDKFTFTSPVGSFRPNALGIYDLGGNAFEWCQDKYDWKDADRVVRGGSWRTGEREYLLSSYRGVGELRPLGDIGFRVVLEVGR